MIAPTFLNLTTFCNEKDQTLKEMIIVMGEAILLKDYILNKLPYCS